jgi:hypothetical protein
MVPERRRLFILTGVEVAEQQESNPEPKTLRQAFEAAKADLTAASADQDQAAPEAAPEEPPKTDPGPGTIEPKPAATEAPASPDGMRQADYTRKTQELARERKQHQADVEFAKEWRPIADLMSSVSQDVQQQIAALLKGKKPDPQPSRGQVSDRVAKLAESFSAEDRGSVMDIVNAAVDEAVARVRGEYDPLKTAVEEARNETQHERQIRMHREARAAFSDFDRACPEWKELDEQELRWFQRDIEDDPDLDPVAYFKERFLPKLNSRGKQSTTTAINKLVERAGKQPLVNDGASAARVEKLSTLSDCFAAAKRDLGFK